MKEATHVRDGKWLSGCLFQSCSFPLIYFFIITRHQHEVKLPTNCAVFLQLILKYDFNLKRVSENTPRRRWVCLWYRQAKKERYRSSLFRSLVFAYNHSAITDRRACLTKPLWPARPLLHYPRAAHRPVPSDSSAAPRCPRRCRN